MRQVNPKQKHIRDHILSYLELFEPATEREIIASFEFAVFENTIKTTLYQLEANGELIYTPRTRTFLLPNNRRNSA